MNKVVRYMIYGILIAGFFAGMGVLLLISRQKHADLTVNSLEITFTDSLKFVSDKDVRTYIDKHYGTYIGQRMDSVNLREIEKLLDSRSAVRNSEAWTTDDQVLHISISQRSPAVRFQKDSIGFYVDDRGFIFPLHPSYTAPVPVVEGAIPVNVEPGYKGEARTAKERQWILDVITLTNFFKSSKNWNSKIERISVDRDGDIVLHTSEGNEEFIIGQPVDIEDKLALIDIYYNTILPTKGAGYYKTVNLKYNKQIICRQKDT